MHVPSAPTTTHLSFLPSRPFGTSRMAPCRCYSSAFTAPHVCCVFIVDLGLCADILQLPARALHAQQRSNLPPRITVAVRSPVP